MSKWTSFYIKTDDLKAVTDQLCLIAQITDISTGDYPHDYTGTNQTDEHLPDYLLVSKTQDNWITVIHNSFNKLELWCSSLSHSQDTIVISVQAHGISSVYYFALYKNGEKKREIEVCYSADFTPVDFGEKLHFEKDHPGYDNEESVFDMNAIENYARQFGLEVRINVDDYAWTRLKAKGITQPNTAPPVNPGGNSGNHKINHAYVYPGGTPRSY